MNFMICLLSWFLWNLAEFQLSKQALDNDGDDGTHLSIRKYADTHWPTWIGSFFCIFILLWVGSRQLSLDPLAPIFGIEAKLGWNDLYLLGSGVAWDAFIFAFKWIKNFFSKKTNEL